MESAIAQLLGPATDVTINSTLARRAHDAEFAGQRADPSEIATNIGIIISAFAGPVFRRPRILT